MVGLAAAAPRFPFPHALSGEGCDSREVPAQLADG